MAQQENLEEVALKSVFGIPMRLELEHGSLAANLHLPPDLYQKDDGETRSSGESKRFPTVLLVHGFGGSRHEHNGLFVKAACALALRGFVALRMDMRGSGETGGSSMELTIESQIADCNNAINHLKEYPFVDTDRLAVLGMSFGGLTAGCTVARRNDIKALVLWEAAFDMIAILKRDIKRLSLQTVREHGCFEAFGTQLSSAFLETLEHLNVEGHASSYTGDVLIVHGMNDTVVTVDVAYQWKRSFTSTDAQVYLIPDADHAFTQDPWAWEAINVSVDWLREKFAG